MIRMSVETVPGSGFVGCRRWEPNTEPYYIIWFRSFEAALRISAKTCVRVAPQSPRRKSTRPTNITNVLAKVYMIAQLRGTGWQRSEEKVKEEGSRDKANHLKNKEWVSWSDAGENPRLDDRLCPRHGEARLTRSLGRTVRIVKMELAYKHVRKKRWIQRYR